MKLAVVHNPAKVGDAEVLRTEIKQRWPDDDVVWFETTVEDPGAGQARAAVEHGAELVLVCGGDGTVAACAGPLADAGVAAALIPFGTGNLLARNLGLPLEIGEALDVAAQGTRDRIDVVRSGERHFTVMAGLGLDAAMMRDTNEDGKDRLGWIAYCAGAVRALRRTHRHMYTLTVDGVRHRPVSALAVLVANVGELQAGMAVAPHADPRDGRIDVIVVAPRSWRDIPALLARLLRHRLPDSPRTSTYRARAVTVSVDEPVPVEFDGDYDTETSELSATVRPEQLVLCAR
jgi:diacylglycerol kinase family enzyme